MATTKRPTDTFKMRVSVTLDIETRDSESYTKLQGQVLEALPDLLVGGFDGLDDYYDIDTGARWTVADGDVRIDLVGISHKETVE